MYNVLTTILIIPDEAEPQKQAEKYVLLQGVLSDRARANCDGSIRNIIILLRRNAIIMGIGLCGNDV